MRSLNLPEQLFRCPYGCSDDEPDEHKKVRRLSTFNIAAQATNGYEKNKIHNNNNNKKEEELNKKKSNYNLTSDYWVLLPNEAKLI